MYHPVSQGNPKNTSTQRVAIVTWASRGIGAATKAAVETLTAILSKELRGRNITVNAVAPGPTSTELFLNGKSDELFAQLVKMNPPERIATPEDIAAVTAFLVGPDGVWVNGQLLRANGGVILNFAHCSDAFIRSILTFLNNPANTLSNVTNQGAC